MSVEDLQQREAETETYTTAEVLAYLEGLRYSESGGSDPQGTN
jgi:hypothetical protein